MLFVELHQAQFVVRNCLVSRGFCGLYNKTSLLGLLTFDSAYYLIFVTERMDLFNIKGHLSVILISIGKVAFNDISLEH